MTPDDRKAIAALFERLAKVAQNGERRDADAEAFIAQAMRTQPEAAYLMAQTIMAQEAALIAAQRRIEAAEGADPFGALLGLDEPARPRAAASGGFLAGATQTALGVAGGVLAAQALARVFEAGEPGSACIDTEDDWDFGL